MVFYNFHWNVLQVPIRMHIIMLQPQWYVTKIPGHFNKGTKTTTSYKAQHINSDNGFELR